MIIRDTRKAKKALEKGERDPFKYYPDFEGKPEMKLLQNIHLNRAKGNIWDPYKCEWVSQTD